MQIDDQEHEKSFSQQHESVLGGHPKETTPMPKGRPITTDGQLRSLRRPLPNAERPFPSGQHR
jgi:hypothetical protein